MVEKTLPHKQSRSRALEESCITTAAKHFLKIHLFCRRQKGGSSSSWRGKGGIGNITPPALHSFTPSPWWSLCEGLFLQWVKSCPLHVFSSLCSSPLQWLYLHTHGGMSMHVCICMRIHMYFYIGLSVHCGLNWKHVTTISYKRRALF